MLSELLPKIIELYYEKECSTEQVATILGVSKTSVNRILKKAGHKSRTASKATKLAFEKERAIRNHTPKKSEHKAKLSAAQKQYLSQHTHQFLGRSHSETTKAKLKGRHRSPETKAKLSTIHKSMPGPMQGKHHSQEVLGKMSQIKKEAYKNPIFKAKMLEIMKEWFSRPDVIEKRKAAMRRRVRDPLELAKMLRSHKPTDIESKMLALIAKYDLPYKYTGDGSFIIAGLNPDFINVNGEKIALEIFGDYWHTLKADKESRTEEGRRKIFAEYGWKLVVLWGHDIKSLSDEAILRRIGHESAVGF